MKPLFIPLKREFYEAFKSGIKDTEYRKFGPRWNSETCRIDRPVVLSLGYGKKNRMNGVIKRFDISSEPTKTEVWEKCYGKPIPGVTKAACIRIEIERIRQ